MPGFVVRRSDSAFSFCFLSPCQVHEKVCPSNTLFKIVLDRECCRGVGMLSRSLHRSGGSAFFSTAPQPCGGSNAAEDNGRLCTKYMGLHLGSVEPDMHFSVRIYHLYSRIQFRENIPATVLVCDGWDASTVWGAQSKVHVFPGTCLLIGQSATFCLFTGFFLAR